MRILAYAASLIGGLVIGVVGAFLQGARFVAAGVTVPWGLVLAIVALVVLVRAAIELTGARGPGWVVLGAWIAVTVAFAAEMPSGDLVISAGGRQMVYLFGGVVAGAAAATVPAWDRLRRPV